MPSPQLALRRLTAPFLVPRYARRILATLDRHGCQAYLVGGGVRDLLLGRPPNDWDVATDAHPDTVSGLFAHVVPTGIEYGTVTVLDKAGNKVEVTTFRADGRYSDGRRPDSVRFAGSIEEDLSRRDFTVNALAMDRRGRLIDPFNGMVDLADKVIRCVGDPAARFDEDALRMMRAVRLAAQLGFDVDPATENEIGRVASTLSCVSAERVRDELSKILLSAEVDWGLDALYRTNLIDHIIPEWCDGFGFEQNAHHVLTLWHHTVHAVTLVPPVLHLRLAALLHDVGKPSALTITDTGRHFHGHEDLSATMAETILRRLRYGSDTVDRVVNLVRHHMDLFNLARLDYKDAPLRRLAAKVGPENVADLATLFRADHLATGKDWTAKEAELSARAVKVAESRPVTKPSMLAIDGHGVMEACGIGPGPEVGRVLRVLVEDALDEPGRNNREYLVARAVRVHQGGHAHA